MNQESAKKIGNVSTHYRNCNLCDANCGVVITHRGSEIISIKGNKNDVSSKGNVCPKMCALQDVHEDPDRLRNPVRRVGDEWVDISWEEAFREIGETIQRIQKDSGQDAISFFYGTPLALDYSAQLMLGLVRQALKTKNYFSSVSLDSLPVAFVSNQLYGSQALIPVPDIERSEFIICLGANPLVSNGSMISVGDIAGKIKSLLANKGEFIVIDPRYTETAQRSSEHIFINPSTDVFLLLAMINCVFTRYSEKIDQLPSYVRNRIELGQMCEQFTPEAVGSITGIRPDKIRELTDKFCSAERALIYSRMGICGSEYGTLSTYLVNVLNIITGNFDKEGGVMFSTPVVDLPGIAKLIDQKGTYNSFKSSVSKLPEFNGELPAISFAEEVLKPDGIKALISWGANIALSTPNGRDTRKALENLEFMVSVDFYINETTKYANIILPPISPLEKSNFNLATSVVMARNIAKYSSPLFFADETSKSDGDILLSLAVAIGSSSLVKRGFYKTIEKLISKLTYDGIVNLLVLIGPYGDFAIDYDKPAKRELLKLVYKVLARDKRNRNGLNLNKIQGAYNGLDLGALKPSMPARLCTVDKKIDLIPDVFRVQFDKVSEKLAESTKNVNKNELTLIGRRDIRSHNSWLHNSKRMNKGKDRCVAIVNPFDAKSLGIKTGMLVELSSEVGCIQTLVKVSDEVVSGVVSVPHGWGHYRTKNMINIAERTPGESINDIIDNKSYDDITGMARLYGVKVTAKAVEEKDDQFVY